MTDLASINDARMDLIDALGNFKDAYFCNMKQWFKMQISKKEFETEIRKMLPQNLMYLHNRFILRLINNCLKADDDSARRNILMAQHGVKQEFTQDSHEPLSKKLRLEELNNSSRASNFVPADLDDYIPGKRSPSPTLIEQQHYSAQEFFLPDLSMIHGRMMLCAWEFGLDGAESAAAEVLVTATQHFLKNILTAIFTRRKGYKVREKRFIHSIGAPLPDPVPRSYCDLTEDFHPTEVIRANRESMDHQNWDKMKTDNVDHEFPREMAMLLSSAIKPTLENEKIKQKIMYEMACSSSKGYERLKSPRISVSDVIEALNVNRSLITSHSVFSVNMERMLAIRQHPSWDEGEGICSF